jgi:hypothetical protein
MYSPLDITDVSDILGYIAIDRAGIVDSDAFMAEVVDTTVEVDVIPWFADTNSTPIPSADVVTSIFGTLGYSTKVKGAVLVCTYKVDVLGYSGRPIRAVV